MRLNPIKILCAAAALVLSADSPVLADALPGPLGASVVRVLDGDTVEVRVLVWHGVWVQTSVRLAGADTPELRGKCAEEVTRAHQARAVVQKLLPPGSAVVLRSVSQDKYAGRVDARLELPDGRDLSAVLIEAGLARPYAGDARKGWCP